MVVLENGTAVVLSDYKWLEFLDCRAAGEDASAARFGTLVGDVVGDVTALASHSAGLDPDRDPFEPIIVTEAGRAFELTPDQWLAYLAASLSGLPCPIADYGIDHGELSPAHELLNGPSARIMAAGVRAVMIANGDEVPTVIAALPPEAEPLCAYA